MYFARVGLLVLLIRLVIHIVGVFFQAACKNVAFRESLRYFAFSFQWQLGLFLPLCVAGLRFGLLVPFGRLFAFSFLSFELQSREIINSVSVGFRV